MSLEANGPLVFHGDKGYSIKSSEGQASYYYSQPFFKMKALSHFQKGLLMYREVHGWTVSGHLNLCLKINQDGIGFHFRLTTELN